MRLSCEAGFAFFYCGQPYSNLAGIKNFDPYGVVPVSYTPEEHRGCNRARTYNVQGRQLLYPRGKKPRRSSLEFAHELSANSQGIHCKAYSPQRGRHGCKE
jgi:hypothetical protein